MATCETPNLADPVRFRDALLSAACVRCETGTKRSARMVRAALLPNVRHSILVPRSLRNARKEENNMANQYGNRNARPQGRPLQQHPLQQQQQTDRVFLDVMGFVLRRNAQGEAKSKAVRCGYAYETEKNGEKHIRITLYSIPVGEWDGQLVIRPQQAHEEGEER